MSPTNKWNKDRLLNSLQDGLSRYFQSNRTPRSLRKLSLSRKKNKIISRPLKVNRKILNTKNNNKEKASTLVHTIKSSSSKTLSKKPDELKLLNDGLTQFYKASDLKRSSLYRCTSRSESQTDDKNNGKQLIGRILYMEKDDKNEKENLSTIRKSQLQILRDGLSGYFSTKDQFRRTACYYSTLKNVSTKKLTNHSSVRSISASASKQEDNLPHRANTLQARDIKINNDQNGMKGSFTKIKKISTNNNASATANSIKTPEKVNNEKLLRQRSNNKTNVSDSADRSARLVRSSKEATRKKLVKKAILKQSRFDQLVDGLSNYFTTSSKGRTRSMCKNDNTTTPTKNLTPEEEGDDDNEDSNSNSCSDENANNSHNTSADNEEESTEADDSKCHQLLGLFDGLSHLYCPGGNRVRKSENFYKEGGCYRWNGGSGNVKTGDGAFDGKSGKGVGSKGRGSKSGWNKESTNNYAFGERNDAVSKERKRNDLKVHKKDGVKRKYVRKYQLDKSNKMRNMVKKNIKNSYFSKKVSKVKKYGGQRVEGKYNSRFKCFDMFPQLTPLDKLLFKQATKKALKLLSATNDVPSNKVNYNYPHFIELGQYDVATWFPSFYPGQFSMCPKLFICEYCLKYVQSQETLFSHLNKCLQTHPPGMEIYKHGGLSVWQVDGNVNKNYCRNLCLLAKLFLQHKTLYLDVEPFLFYVLTLNDSRGSHMVGYFSKEKFCPQRFNLSCLMVLPQFQRQGYGRLLIHFSYLLTKREGLFGSPEKPLSELGRLTYMGYWKSVLIQLIHQAPDSLSIRDISKATGMSGSDIVSTLEALQMIALLDDAFVLVVDRAKLKSMYEDLQKKKILQLNEENLNWRPLHF